MREYNITGLIDKEYLDNQIKINDDGYGGACVNVAINAMEYLDTLDQEFNIGYSPDMTTPHGIICHCDDQGGITGFMAGVARNIITVCHEKGWKFYLADLINSYNTDDQDTIDKYITNLLGVDSLNLDESVVREYVVDLIKRYNECVYNNGHNTSSQS